jgi:hypothetical protein
MKSSLHAGQPWPLSSLMSIFSLSLQKLAKRFGNASSPGNSVSSTAHRFRAAHAADSLKSFAVILVVVIRMLRLADEGKEQVKISVVNLHVCCG